MSTLTQKNNIEPSTPASGSTVIYVDSTSKKLSTKDDAASIIGYASTIEAEQAKVSANDTTGSYLESKIVAGTNVTIATLNDGSNETLQITASGASINPDNDIDVIDPLILSFVSAEHGPLSLRGSNNGAGAGNAGISATDPRQIGGVTLTCGSGVAGNRSGLYTATAGAAQFIFGVTSTQTLTLYVSINALGTASTDGRFDFWGFGNNHITGEHEHGVYFSYNPNENSGKFSAVTAKASAREKTDTGITPVVDQIYKLQIVIDDDSGLTAKFYIDDVLVATKTNNIPDTPATACGLVFKVQRINSTTTLFRNSILGYIRYQLISSGRYI